MDTKDCSHAVPRFGGGRAEGQVPEVTLLYHQLTLNYNIHRMIRSNNEYTLAVCVNIEHHHLFRISLALESIKKPLSAT